MSMTVAFENALTVSPDQSRLGSRPGAAPSVADVQYSPSSAHPTAPVTREIQRVNPPGQAIRTFEISGVRGELLTFAKCDTAELEFLMPSHLVVLLPDGISRGCEWSNGRETRKVPSAAQNTIVFNPAQAYLRIRTSILQDYCRVLMLRIQPTVMSRLCDPDMDLTNIRFQQQIGLDDQGASQALVAIQEEIESSGLSSVFYVRTLLMLLMTRLIRCASNCAAPRQPASAKGGLPNWRLKLALELLEDDLAKAPTLAELAQPLRLHPTSFCRAFKRSMGVSPHRYLLARRVNRAKEMMKDQKRSLTQIALDCGFRDSSQFSVVFKRITGVCPRSYRGSL
jgi:AraC family transcriptional regulator